MRISALLKSAVLLTLLNGSSGAFAERQYIEEIFPIDNTEYEKLNSNITSLLLDFFYSRITYDDFNLRHNMLIDSFAHNIIQNINTATDIPSETFNDIQKISEYLANSLTFLYLEFLQDNITYDELYAALERNADLFDLCKKTFSARMSDSADKAKESIEIPTTRDLTDKEISKCRNKEVVLRLSENETDLPKYLRSVANVKKINEAGVKIKNITIITYPHPTPKDLLIAAGLKNHLNNSGFTQNVPIIIVEKE